MLGKVFYQARSEERFKVSPFVDSDQFVDWLQATEDNFQQTGFSCTPPKSSSILSISKVILMNKRRAG